ncbi:hypothetical protein Pfo_031495 [Paulownia fortunei]|nr:hypothetical protein Pfo_031495 [Paulownia fortunei]
MADFVPDQIYNLPQTELVSVSRTDSLGNQSANSNAAMCCMYLTQLVWRISKVRGSFLQTADGTVNYYATNGAQVQDSYVTTQKQWATIKGQIVVTGNQKSYYDANTGNLIKNDFLTPDQGKTWYYADQDGNLVVGAQEVNGHKLYFDDNGIQIKDQIISNDGQQYYYQGDNGDLVTNRYISYNDGWYYANAIGVLVTGQQIINGETQYFSEDGRQVKGQIFLMVINSIITTQIQAIWLKIILSQSTKVKHGTMLIKMVISHWLNSKVTESL